MGASFEKVTAEEFARRHGWRRSAVVYRIKAGIYDGVEEDGVWYVLRNAPEEMQRSEPDAEVRISPELPWATTPFPIPWVGPVFWIGLSIAVFPVIGGLESVWLFGTGFIVATATQLYEGLATGTIRAQYATPVTYSKRPISFVFNAVCWLVYVLVGLFVIGHSVIH